MVEVRLHGALAQEFGKVWHFDIQSPAEAFRALQANCAGFAKKVLELDSKGLVFKVKTSNYDYSTDDVQMSLGSARRLDIVPIVVGSSANTRFVVGAIMVAVGYAISSTWAAPASKPLIMGGISLMLGSVVEWLTPTPKKADEPGGLDSWSVSGPTNTVDQGLPVPVIYGEVLAGGYTISAGVAATNLTVGQTVEPSVSIGGETSFLAAFQYNGTPKLVTAVFTLSVGVLNMEEPYVFNWTITGFSGSSAVRVINSATAVVTVEVDYLINSYNVAALTGNANVLVTGRKAGTSTSYSGPSNAGAVTDKPLNLYIQGVNK